MNATEPRASLRGFDPITLGELQHRAALQNRMDRKYVVSRAVLDTFLEEMRKDARVLSIDGAQSFRYESVYFDTKDLRTYRAAATGRPRRFKVRTRTYVDSRRCSLEVKSRQRNGMTLKRRMPYAVEDRDWLTPEALEFLGGFEGVSSVRYDLWRSLTTRYERTTLFDTSSASRVTIDTGLQFIAAEDDRCVTPDLVVIETKTGGAPCRADRILWREHHRPAKISKYCVGLAVLHPELPSNRWNRVIRSHFDIAPTVAGRSQGSGFDLAAASPERIVGLLAGRVSSTAG